MEHQPPRMTAKKSMDFEQFIDNISVLLNMAWGEDWGEFSIARPTSSNGRNVPTPQIVYSLKKLEPGLIGKNTREIKPRLREQKSIVSPLDGQEKILNIKGQVVDCHVEFTIYGATNTESNKVAKGLRDLLETYKGFLMGEGMQNMWFKEDIDRNEDENLEDEMASRRLVYHVRLEELIEEEVGKTKEIVMNFKVARTQMELEGALPSQQI